jgi:hypothetical protein
VSHLKAYWVTKRLLSRLEAVQAALSAAPELRPSQQYDAWEIEQSIAGALGSLSKIQRAALNWQNWEVLHEQLVIYTMRGIQHSRDNYCSGIAAEEGCQLEHYGDGRRKVHFLGPLLPFDTLMMTMPMQTRLDIAVASSLAYSTTPYVAPGGDLTLTRPGEEPLDAAQRKLRLGFISFDFNDHPTAHLIEAVFQIIRAAQQQPAQHAETDSGDKVGSSTSSIFNSVELVIFNYGRDDGSRYRHNLEQLAHTFVNVVEMSFSEAADAIREQRIDIFLDLQIHTLGSRLEITASGVAPTVVNYLVFPGTSGARFYDYFVADKVVVPPEYARYYSEALLLLPPTYQVSSYDSYVAPAEFNDNHGTQLELRR